MRCSLHGIVGLARAARPVVGRTDHVDSLADDGGVGRPDLGASPDRVPVEIQSHPLAQVRYLHISVLAVIGTMWSLSDLANSSSRDALVRFWLACPADQVENLAKTGFDQATADLIRQLSPTTAFSDEQVSLRDSINRRLTQEGLQQPMASMAVFLYSPIGLMQIADPVVNLPDWLNQFYQQVYAQNEQAGKQVTSVQSVSQPTISDFGPFPLSLQDLVGNRIHLNRILGLSNLYYIDPDDREIYEELKDVRSALADLISAAPEQSLQQIWSGDFGDRYWAMVRSGIQNEPLSPEDENRKSLHRKIKSKHGWLSIIGALNAFLVSMLFYKPGTMQVNNAESQLPEWLYPTTNKFLLML